MDASVFGFKNNSNEIQEIDIFQSSTLGAATLLEPVWNFEANYGVGVLPVYNVATGLWFDTTVVNKPGSIGIRLWQEGGNTFVVSVTNSAIFNNTTTAQMVVVLNENAILNVIGTWSIEGPYENTEGELGVLGTFNIRLIPFPSYLAANEISPSPKFNYGVQSISVQGGGGAPTFDDLIIYPRSTAVAPSLVTNPNVSIETSSNFSYSDFVWSTIGRTYDVKNFQIFSDNKQQLLQPFLFDRTLATGRVYQKVLTPTIDPYQQQNYIVTPEEKGYILDGFTKIKYNLLPQASVRLMMDYTYVDISTPLIAKLASPQINQSLITPDFVKWQELGYDKFGCKWFTDRIKVLSDKLKKVSGKSGRMHPKWQEQLKARLIYLKQMMISYDCVTSEEAKEIPELSMVGPELKRLNLWMPSPEFVQSQLDDEQGARKLFKKHDFPIVKE